VSLLKVFVNDIVELFVLFGSVLASALLISDIPARCPSPISAQGRTDVMADRDQKSADKNSASGSTGPVLAAGAVVERTKQIVTGMVRSEKEMYWLGVRMENFLRAYESRINTVSLSDACDYLEGLLRKGQALSNRWMPSAG
jgi:hypothetical protein